MTDKENLENKEETQDFADNSTESLTNESNSDENLGAEEGDADNSADELAQLKDSYLRLMAEYDNYRKRTVKEKADLIKNGGERVLIGLLPVIDDFERALQNITPETDSKSIGDGVNLIYSKFIAFLKSNGVLPIEALGKPFDEELFDAIATIPTQDEEAKGNVIDCVLTGYKLNDKVIRHSKVVVAE